MTSEYERGLRAVLRRQPLVLAMTVGTFLLTIFLYTIVPKGFFPQQDTGRIGGQIRGQQDVSFDALQEKATAMVDIVRKEPGVQNVMMFLGAAARAAAAATRPTCLSSCAGCDSGRRRADGGEIIAEPAPEDARDPGRARCTCSRAGAEHRRPQLGDAVSVHADERNLDELKTWSPQADGGDAEAAGAEGCGDGPAEAGLADAAGDRSRHGEPAGSFSADDRRHACRTRSGSARFRPPTSR